nr:immunoglobulin light chain junction region [Macaca mulatta]MOW08456.1 immunoglobulin light chain junction region [Macaca mulatta]MOW08880.1 immunoglobulin light chain junction region [Macaca mulatta]MOW09434.1 immunoglobulin light chain junction region [Macaca mulatta]MOW10116.1 immunoglobulin light chain junction region [Macaca mulatta]
CQQHDSYPPSF